MWTAISAIKVYQASRYYLLLNYVRRMYYSSPKKMGLTTEEQRTYIGVTSKPVFCHLFIETVNLCLHLVLILSSFVMIYLPTVNISSFPKEIFFD